MITLNKEDAFTIVDIISKAQEVIRCKDCKYWENEEDGVGFCARTEDWDWDADDFCSRGERAE